MTLQGRQGRRAALALVALVAWCACHVDHVEAVDVSLFPPCQASSIPPVAGYVSQNNLVLDAGCRYNLYEKNDAASCLKGNWIVIAGSSNTLLEFNNLINFLAPKEFDIDRTGELIGISALVDAIVEDGEVTHWEQIPNVEPACRQLNMSDTRKLEPQCKDKMVQLLSKAPRRHGAIRVTFVTAFFWARSDLAMDVIDEVIDADGDGHWKNAKLGFITQIGAWYYYCSKLKFSYCPRKELIEQDMYGKGMQTFKEEMEVSLERMQSWCHSGRVQLGCYLQTISWSDGKGERETYADMNVYIQKAMTSQASSKFQLIDFYQMGGNMPEEVHGGHGSILLNLWMWTVMFNSICPAGLASEKVNAVFDGVMCSGTQLRWANCPKYHHFCTHGGPACEKWECMNSVQCTLRASNPPEMGDTKGMCDAALDISGFAAAEKTPCHRLWCHEHVQWLLPAAVTVLALLLKLFLLSESGKQDVSREVQQADGLSPVSPARNNDLELTKPAPVTSPTSLSPKNDVEMAGVAGAEVTSNSRAPLLELRTPKEVSEVQIDIPRAGHKYPLGLARFMASSHVVMGHLFARGVIEPLYFFGWGFTWVPWFFMLSGFVLFSAYLNKPKTDSMFGYVLRRSGTIYPLYAFALFLAFLLGKVRGNIYTEWPTLLAQSFLMQAWVPYFTENALQMHCWFLSCMVVYWFFFPPMSKALKDIGLLQTWLLMIFFFFLPWLLILIPLYTHEEVDWYKEHDFYQTDSYLDLGVIMLKYHPICYFHVFILGMLLAKLRQLLDVHARSLPHGCFSWRNPYNLVLQFIAPLGYAGVFIVFSDQDLDAKAWGYKLSARVSVLLPFQAMILFGLAGLPSLPFPLFSYAFSMMDFLENYSYAVYVFQFLLYALWRQTGHVNLPLFLVFVYASAYIIGNCIQQPLQKWWAAHPNGQLAVPFLLAAFFMAGCFCPTFGESVPTMEDLPRVIRLNEAMVDMDLGLTDAGHVGPGEGAAIINPSVLLKDDEVIVLARRHRRETRQQNGWYEAPDGERTKAVIIEQVWHSTILMGSQKFRDQTLVTQMFDHWPRSNMSLLGNLSLDSWVGLSTKDGDAWRDLCVVERWIPSNKTLMRLVVTGPEDPKIVTTGTGYEIAFDSQPPKSVTTCRRNTKGMLDSVAQMYLASGVQNTERWRPTRAYRLSYGSYDVAEKNWIPFVYQGSVETTMAVFLLTANPRAREASRQAYLEASAMRLARPASAPQLRSSTLPQAPAMPVTPLQLLRARARPSSAWAPAVVEASRADETCRVAAAASLSKAASEDHSEPDRSGDRCTCEVSESSLVSTQQPLEHSETSQELDLPEEDCDDANEAELQGRVEALRRKDLQERMMKLQQQQKDLEEEQQEVQKLLQRTPKRTTGRPQSAASRTRGGGSAAELRIDGKAISGTTSRVTPKSRPSSSSSIPGALRRSASAPGQRQEAKKSLRDLHYESMRRQAAQRLELLKQREIQREPWTHGGSRPSRPWSAIPGYTGYRPHMEEDSMVGCNWSRASLQCIRLFGKPGM